MDNVDIPFKPFDVEKPLSVELTDFEYDLLKGLKGHNPVNPNMIPTGYHPGSFIHDDPVNPDCIAFYTPENVFNKKSWGIYIVSKNFVLFINKFHKSNPGLATRKEWLIFLRYYLFSHERFHHRMETFSDRLSPVLSKYIYDPFHIDVYKKTRRKAVGDEALAEAYALKQLTYSNNFKKLGFSQSHFNKMILALKSHIRNSSKGYNMGVAVLKSFDHTLKEYSDKLLDKAFNGRPTYFTPQTASSSTQGYHRYLYEGKNLIKSRLHYI
jgi:hypothetical protein